MPFALFLSGVLLLVLQSVLHTLVPASVPLPALAFFAPIYAALSPRFTYPRVVVLSFATGYLFDLLSGAPVGMHAFAMPVAALAGVIVGTRLQIAGPFGRAIAGFILTLLLALTLRLARAISGAPSVGGTAPWLLQALLSAAFAPPIFALFDRFERRFDRSAVRIGPRRNGTRDTGIELLR